MQFEDFAALDPGAVASLVAEKAPQKLGIGIPFNGTRRWYLATYNREPADVESSHYALEVRRRIWEIVGMMFADGVTAVYTPSFGRSLIERGPQYMAFAAHAIRVLADDEAINWHLQNRVAACFYGEIYLLPAELPERLNWAERATKDGERYLHYGIFADRPQPDLISRTIKLYQHLGTAPTEEQLAEDYYHSPFIPLNVWIGSDQPTVFDVPLIVREHTALYFLQFPTLYLDQRTWRRLLYDYLFVRGEEEALYPENITRERRISGLGVRRNGYWLPSTN